MLRHSWTKGCHDNFGDFQQQGSTAVDLSAV